MRGIAGLLTGPSRPDRPAWVETMRVAMGARSRYLHSVHHTQALTVCVGGAVPAAPTSGSPPPPGLVVACDARLDNQSGLAVALGCADDPDAVVTASYVRWGPDCVLHLKGDFALSVWDPRREVLFLARDRLGVRPMHYAGGDGWFAFASEAKALLALPDVPRTSSEDRIVEFLQGKMPAADVTLFDAIARLPAAHTLTVTNGARLLEQYWSWTLPAQAVGGDLPEQLSALLTQAVARRTPAIGPAAVTLSGGLDSSTIAATMATLERYGSEPVPTYSIVFDDRPDVSERRYIEAVVARGQFAPRFVSLGIEDPFASFDRLLMEQDGLFLAPTLAMAPDLLAGLPRGAVVLDGHGGDEVISHGYERFSELASAGDWFNLWREARGAARVTGVKSLDILSSYYQMHGRGGWHLNRVVRRLSGVSVSDRPAHRDLLSERLMASGSADGRPVHDSRATLCARERHMAILSEPGQQHALEVLDRKAAAAGLERRFPFWDEDLIAFMLSVPADLKLRGGWTRWILREAMKDRLPDCVRLRRDKHDFAHHMTPGLRTSPAASLARFQHDAEKLAPYLNLAALATVRQRVDTGGAVAPSPDLRALWRATAVAEWIDYADRNAIRIVP